MNKVPVNTGVSLYNLADHKFVYFLTQLTPATPFVIIAVAAIIFLVVRPCYRTMRQRLFADTKEIKEMMLDQDIDPFFEVLKQKQRDYWIQEEYECTAKLDIPRLKPEVFVELKKTKETPLAKLRPRLQGVHNYDILSNPFYAEKYLYVPAVYHVRSKFAISQYPDKERRIHAINLARYVVDFPYMRYQRAMEFEFKSEFMEVERQEKKDIASKIGTQIKFNKLEFV